MHAHICLYKRWQLITITASITAPHHSITRSADRRPITPRHCYRVAARNPADRVAFGRDTPAAQGSCVIGAGGIECVFAYTSLKTLPYIISIYPLIHHLSTYLYIHPHLTCTFSCEFPFRRLRSAWVCLDSTRFLRSANVSEVGPRQLAYSHTSPSVRLATTVFISSLGHDVQ